MQAKGWRVGTVSEAVGIAQANGPAGGGTRAGGVVGIAAVRSNRTDGWMVRHQPVGGEMVHDALLHFRLAHRAAPGRSLSDHCKGDIVSRACVFGGLEVHGPLFVVPACLEKLYQIAGRDNLRSKGAHQLNGSGIHAGHVRVGVARHIFHGYPPSAVDQAGDSGFQFLPAQVDLLRARQSVECVRLDTVDELAGLALKHRLPSIFPKRDFVQAGGLMAYGENLTEFYRRAASFVDRILKGAKAGELPVEQAPPQLAINRKTARALGVTIPK